MAGYEAVPDVLQKGLVTDIQDSYKGKDENRLIVSAPSYNRRCKLYRKCCVETNHR